MKATILAILLASPLFAQDSANVAAWGRTAWGMTEQEVQNLYPTAVSVDPPPEALASQKANFTALAIESFLIEAAPFKVGFRFDAQRGLQHVDLSLSSKRELDVTPSVRKLEELLTQKYGRPDLREAKNDGGIRVLWNKPNLSISLNYAPFPALDVYMVYVSYSKPEKSTLDRL